MAALRCPLCGATVKVERPAINTRFSCKKCHTPFHLNKDRLAVVGDPPDVEAELAEMKEKLRQTAKRLPVGRLAAGLVALAVAGVVLYALFGPAERLDRAAGRAARAVADNDPAALRSIAAPDTAEDVARWLAEVYPRLAQARETWRGQDEAVEVHVAQEDRARRTGVVGIEIRPVASSARDVTLADPAAATAAAVAPFGAETVWVLNRWGRWKLDGRATYAKVRGSL